MSPKIRQSIGTWLCGIGIGIALLTLVPNIVPLGDIPWPIFVGSAIYLPGSFILFTSANGTERNQTFNILRMVRLGFLVILFVFLFRSING